MRRMLAACVCSLAVLAPTEPLRAEPTLTFSAPNPLPPNPTPWGFDPTTQMLEVMMLSNGTFNFKNTDGKYTDFHFEFPDQGVIVTGKGGSFFTGFKASTTTLDFAGPGIEPDSQFTIAIAGFTLPSGTNIKATPTTAVPEPSTLVMASLAGLVGLGYAWHRCRRATT